MDEVQLLPPETHPIGEIRYIQRYGPLGSALDVARARLATATTFLAPELGEVERAVTHEGEYAALVPIWGRLGDRRVRRLMGIVFGDNFTTLLDAIGVVEASYDELETLVRQLIEQTTLVLGARKRRFLYAPPSGWQPLPNVFVTNWYPPEFPKTSACITVYPATPTLPLASEQVVEASILEERAKGSQISAAAEPSLIAGQGGLSGSMWQLEIEPTTRPHFTRDLVALEDARYIYPMRLDAHVGSFSDKARESFWTLVETVEPIPSGAPTPKAVEAFGFWIS